MRDPRKMFFLWERHSSYILLDCSDRKIILIIKFYLFSRECCDSLQFSSVQLLSRIRLFVTPWTTAHQASLSINNSRSSPKPMFIESVMISNHLILCRPLLLLPSIFPRIRVFSNELFAPGGQSIGVSASTSVLPMNTQDWSPLGWTGWISLQTTLTE